MYLKSNLILLVILFSYFHEGVYALDCAPEGAQTIRMYANATLIWQIYQGENCNITQFDVDISNNGSVTYYFGVVDNFVDLSFLDICELWEYTITPISNGIIGLARSLTEYIPVPPDADLSLSYFNVTRADGRNALFEWDLASRTYGDCTIQYHLTGLDKELNTSFNTYIFGGNYYLTDTLSPCVPYQFSLRAYNKVEDRFQGAPLEWADFEIDPQPQVGPRVDSVVREATSFKVTLILEGSSNRCPLQTLYVDGGSYFNFSMPVENSMEWLYLVDVEVTSLNPSSMYTFKVYVENSGGFSPATHLAVQTLNSSSD